jgi:hypothetical protein
VERQQDRPHGTLTPGAPHRTDHHHALRPVLADQLGWRSGRELLAADDAESIAQACARLDRDPGLWHCLRSAALPRVAQDCSQSDFDTALAAAL